MVIFHIAKNSRKNKIKAGDRKAVILLTFFLFSFLFSLTFISSWNFDVTGVKTINNNTYNVNGTYINASSTTCSGTDKFSAYNNATGVFTCTTDSTSAGGNIKSGGRPYLYNDSTTIYGNDSYINSTYPKRDDINSTQFLSTSTNITLDEAWINSLIGGASNPFDQSLNTTDNVTFNNVTVTDKLKIGEWIGDTLGLTLTDDSSDLTLLADVGGINSFFLETNGAFLELIANPGIANGYRLFSITETQGADTEINFYEGGTGHNRFWDSGSARFGGGESYLCSNLTNDVDCDTPATGADIVVEDDGWFGGKLFASDWTNVTITESQISNLGDYSTNTDLIGNITSLSNSTIARIGDCPSGEFVQNITTGGVECLAPSGSGDITSVQGDNIYIYNGSDSGNVLLAFNETKLNETINSSINLKEPNLNVNNSNSSDYWVGANDYNQSQFEIIGLVFNIRESWLSSMFDSFLATKTTDDLTQGSTNFYDNRSFNQSLTDTLYAPSGSGNASWNESLADTLYAPITEPLWTANSTDYSKNESFNSTQFTTTANITLSETWLDTLFPRVSDVVTQIAAFFDQSLNTTSDVTFNNLDVSNNLTAINISATNYFGDGSQLTGIPSITTIQNYFGNGTNLNETYADTIYYPLLTNPLAYWNSTWAGFNQTFASTLYKDIGIETYNSTNFPYTDDLNFTNGANYWNDTYATFNKTYGDTLYAPIGSGNASFNQSLTDTLYSPITEPLWTANSTNYALNQSFNSTQFTTTANITISESWLDGLFTTASEVFSILGGYFDQDLNTTSSVIFAGVNSTGNVTVGSQVINEYNGTCYNTYVGGTLIQSIGCA